MPSTRLRKWLSPSRLATFLAAGVVVGVALLILFSRSADGGGAEPNVAERPTSSEPSVAPGEPCGADAQHCSTLALVSSQPVPGAINVDPQAGFRFQFSQPLAPSVAPIGVVERVDGSSRASALDSSISLDLTGQNLSFVLDKPLAPTTRHRLTLSGIRSADGQELPAIEISFTTGTLATASNRFTQSTVGSVPGATGVVVGPDGHAYVTTFEGEIIRFGLDEQGRPTGERSVVITNSQRRFIALAFDPSEAGQVWVSQWDKMPADAFSSSVVVYDFERPTEPPEEKLVGLPRHPNGDHSVQALAFRADKLYVSVGSATSGGRRSLLSWGEPVLEETPISASVIEVDYGQLTDTPLDLQTFDVSDESDPVRLFATGLRNAYGFVWHRNGNLYANINQNSGLGRDNAGAPSEGPCQGLPEFVDSHLVPDTLNLVKRGRYYGHPNPTRQQCVVMGGGSGPFTVSGYAPNQPADPDFDPSLVQFYAEDTDGSFGVSVNGIAEYLGPGSLSGALVSADFSGSRSLLIVKLDAPVSELAIAGPIERVRAKDDVAFTYIHPLDVATTMNGLIFVADFGQWGGGEFGNDGAVYLLTPVTEAPRYR